MCVHAAQTAKPSRGDANALEVRKFDATIVANHHILNVPLAIDEGTDLSARLMRQFAQLSSKFGCDDLVGRYAASVQLFYAP